jgi:Aspartyl protease
MKYVIPLELIELEEFNYHLVVKSVFKEGTKALWVIDTGASKTVFDRSLTDNYDAIPLEEETTVHSAGIGSDHLDTALGMLHEFYLGDLLITPMKVALLDLSHINTLYYHVTEKEICGLIGSDFLLENKAVIDYAQLKIILDIN